MNQIGLRIPFFRLGLATLIILSEILVLSILIDARTISGDSVIAKILAEAGNLLRWLIASIAVLALCMAKDFRERTLLLTESHSFLSFLFALFVHCVIFVVLVIISFIVFDPTNPGKTYFSYAWIVLVLLAVLSAGLLVTSATNWKIFLAREKYSILVAAVGGGLIFAGSLYFQRYWGSMTGFTLESTRVLLDVIYSDIFFDPKGSKLGVRSFWVHIDPVCSGIEGMVLSSSTAAIYLYLSRQYLRFPHALIILPLACAISVALNIVRIATLIVIGAELSPGVAVGGFHSVAGWIASVFVALLIVFVFSNWSWIQKRSLVASISSSKADDSKLAIAILVPFVFFASLSLISGIFVKDFDYLYPGKTILVLLTGIYFWKTYRIRKPNNWVEPIIAGSVVAVVWIVLIPEDPQKNALIDQALSAMSLGALVSWSLFRMIGFFIVAPVLEELVFRGYLICRISGQELVNDQRLVFSFSALIVSSVLFGILHNAWIAGTVAGALFAFVRFRSETIASPIIAHSAANVLVAMWALHTKNWVLI